MIMPLSVLLRMRNVLDKYVEKTKTQIYLQLQLSKNRAVYKIMHIKIKFIFVFPLYFRSSATVITQTVITQTHNKVTLQYIR